MKDVQTLRDCTGFQWDDMNVHKNWLKHRVSVSECEQVFFNRPLAVNDDQKHSLLERRYHALGQTDAGRLLFVAFAIRDTSIRIISARDMSKKERRAYVTA
jgi:uncharacterized protein